MPACAGSPPSTRRAGPVRALPIGTTTSGVSGLCVAGGNGPISGVIRAFHPIKSAPARSPAPNSALRSRAARGEARLVLAAWDVAAKKSSSSPERAGSGSTRRASEMSSASGPDENGTSSASRRARRSSTLAGAGSSGTLRSAVRSPPSSEIGACSRAADAADILSVPSWRPTSAGGSNRGSVSARATQSSGPQSFSTGQCPRRVLRLG
jgi:hypothetical protein